jgi:hypothetical protein
LRCLRGNNNLIYRTVDAVFCDSIPLSVHAVQGQEENILLYPNPAADHYLLEIPDEYLPAEMRVHDGLGRLLDIQTMRQSPQRFDTPNLNTEGILIISIIMKNRSIVKKLLFSKKHVH